MRTKTASLEVANTLFLAYLSLERTISPISLGSSGTLLLQPPPPFAFDLFNSTMYLLRTQYMVVIHCFHSVSSK